MISQLYGYGGPNMTAVADPYVVGIAGKAGGLSTNRQLGNPAMMVQSQSPAPPIFPVQEWFGGLKTAIYRVLPTSVPGRPTGPPRRNLGVIRGRRVALSAPVTTERAVQRGPAQLTQTRPLWESYLWGSDGYMAR